MYNESVTKVVQEVVLERRSTAKDLAKKIGKPYPTLMRELNPFDGGAKLGADTMLDIMKSMHNIEPLRYMAEALGYTLVPASKASPAERLEVGKAFIPAHAGPVRVHVVEQ